MIPENLLNLYSMDGQVDIQTSYISNGGSHRAYYSYSEELVNSFIKKL